MHKNVFAPAQYLPGHTIKLVLGGEPYFAHLLQLINSAQKHLHFQVYIFDEDETGREVAEALKKARQRGVEIFLTVDSYGSKSLSAAFINDLKASGLHFKLFSPLPEHFYVFRLGRRLHNKVVVADHSEALVGGINISNKYRGSDRETPWLDFAVAVKGPVCADLSRLCERIYREKYFGKLKNPAAKGPSPTVGNVRSRVALTDWFRRKNQIGADYRAAFQKAQHSIIVVASYFLPSRSIRTALKNAAQRGVQITLLLPGKSDLPLAKNANRYLYGELLEEDNIQLYEWNKSVLHGKLAVVDHKWVTVGSYNLNHLSQYSSIEMNVEVLDEGFAASVEDCFAELIQQSTQIPADRFKQEQRFYYEMFDWASYTLARWTMLLLFFLIRRDHQYKEKE